MTPAPAPTGPRLRVALAQLNLLVGDIEGNAEQAVAAAVRARDEMGADLVVFPELTLTAYPPEDLLLRPELYTRVDRALAGIGRRVTGIDLLLGYPERAGKATYNACVLLRDGTAKARYRKRYLPNYGVFDEKRYFLEGDRAVVAEVAGIPCGLTICEDIWLAGPAREAAAAGARLLLNLNASPYHTGKGGEREAAVSQRARENALPVVYVNLVGGQDELVFDGGSFVVDREGRPVYQAPYFEAGLYRVEIGIDGAVAPARMDPAPPPQESMYRALVLGVRDYIRKNGFKGAVIGLSGGIDSALTLAIAADAIGPEQVEAVLMPSRYTADMSVEDARIEAEILGVRHHTVSIEPLFQAFLQALAEPLAGSAPDTTEENIQARCRGVILMAISNKQGRIVLTTGNKSEMSVGYATLYGDMAGGFAPLKDVAKLDVFRLARWRNRDTEVIPRRVLERPPSAELAPDQKDEDSLPPYAVLDAILERYIEQDQCREKIIDQGYKPDVVDRVIGMVNRNEYKRRQAAPGVRITRRAFGRDRRYPITSGF